MKTTISIFLFCWWVFTACNKQKNDDDTNGTPDNCIISRLSQQGDTAALNTYFSFNAQWLPTRVKTSGSEIIFSYNENKVIQQEAGITRVYTIGNDSLAQYSILKSGADKDSTIYMYSNEKYLIKSIRYLNGVKKDSVGYVIENGNVKSMTYYNEFGYVNYFRTFTYHTSLEAKHWMYTKLGGDYGYFFYPWLGKPNKNLIKSSAQYSDIDSYTYEFDSNGKIKKIQVTVFGTPNISSTVNVEHSCR